MPPSPPFAIPAEVGPRRLRLTPTIVGVGASAGGLDAFVQLLQALPNRTNLAFVFVQHLAPQYESSLPSLIGSKTQLRSRRITSM
jgi:two-component system CheB/CheR fusion protein